MKKEKTVISDIWNCYSPYFKGKKEDIDKLIEAEGISETSIVNKVEHNNIISFKYTNGDTNYVNADFVMDIIEKYPDIIVACILDGDPECGCIMVAVAISEYGYPYMTDGDIIGTDAEDDSVTTARIVDLFADCKYEDTCVHSGSGIGSGIYIDYSFPFYDKWDDKTFLNDVVKTESSEEPQYDIDYTKFKIKDGLLRKCELDEERIVVPKGVEKIGKNAFYFWHKTKNIIMQDGVKEINNGAFLHLRNLKKVTMPEGVTKIGNSAFEGCGIRKLKVPDSVTYIGKEAFYNSGLEQIIIPQNVKTIGEGAFSECDHLKEVKIYGRITKIKDKTFDWSRRLNKVEIPETVRIIGNEAFGMCLDLSDINITDNVKEIGEGAFSRCGFKELIIPKARIGRWAFSSCYSLTNVVISKGVDRLESCVFYDCHSLVSIVLPESIISIADDTFKDCKKLTIRCTEGSYAEEYAKSHGIKYSIM